ncbi:MAG TPA: nucleotide exchange factor GrpE [Candidatus Avacidaminococcus intestinavium]|uniref:Protein GrpE n=1 Tax=Candidatus Avacidaminococcus intestinavium TaxID=2840684 RepID=A0A9D1MMY5_9FIRM|nr:nucleotide exchange factor GrpE [Candidatus Avacidaminococcus intestinavium]
MEEKQQEVKDEIVDTQKVEETTECSEKATADVETAVVEEKDKRIEELQTRNLRLQADFDNFRRRTVKEQAELASFVTVNVVKKFLEVLDSFDRAEDSIQKADNVESLKVGIDMIKRQLTQTLTDLAVEEIPAAGEKFDPVVHEAVMRGVNSELEDGMIETVFEKGYKINDKVIRHSKVKVVNND